MIAQLMKKLRIAQQNLLELKTQKEQTLARQMQLRQAKQEYLKTATGRRIIAEEEIARLTESAKALESLINNLINEKKKSEAELAAAQAEKNKRKHKGPAQLRSAMHRIPWPVYGKVIANFGKSKHPDLDTIVVSNGIKIDCAPEAQVKCVEKGDILFSGEFRAYGKMIIIEHHGDFYSIYGQLAALAVEEGAKVSKGDVIGTLGKAEHVLYFEVRSGNHPEDPLPWLK
jgi:septal ring factor EnvC (AmiA/AmiB activator)